MKRIVPFLFIILVLVPGCKLVNKLTHFNMDYNVSVVIPSSTGINLPFNLFTPDISSNSESTFAVNDTRKDLVEVIKLTKLDMTLTAPPSGNFGFLKSIEIFISAQGLPEEKIAWKYNIPSDVEKYLKLETTNTDLKEYIKKDEFTLRFGTVTDEFLTSDHKIDVHAVFFVDAKILGQ
jgi:hypothetical protein